MKTKQLLIAFILLMMAGTGASVRAQVAINATNFPDDIFRQWVLDNCDTDGDGTLSTTEAAKKLINVQGKGIANLKGIEHFTAATVLNISENQLTTVDLSKNTKLTRLDCYNNQLTKLSVTKNTALTKISCYGNKIKGTNMTNFINSLPTVSTGTLTLVTNNPEANEGNTYTEANAIAATKKGWAVQDADLNLLVVGINATNFPDDIFRGFVGRYDSNDDGILSTSEVEAVETINVSSMGIADLTGIKHFTNVKELYCDHNQLTSLSSLSGLKNLEVLHCEYNQLTAITIGLSGFAKLLTELYCHNNQLTTLNILAEAPTTGKLVVRNTDGTEGNTVGNDANIAKWNEKNWKVYSTDGSTLTELRPTEVIINLLNFPDQKFRTYVNKFDTNSDGSLSDSELQAATDIDVTNLGVTSLQGIEYFTEATIIRCGQNQLTELDLSQNTKLKFLYAQQNQLEELNLSKNTKLQKVTCWNNHIYSGMGRLFANLPTVSNAAEIVVYNNASGEGNRYPSASQVMRAVDRNWHVFTRDNNGPYELEALPDVQLNAMNFPDENFRSFLSEKFDSDGDGTLSGDELRAAQYVYCDGREITSLKGIEFLTEMIYLICENNNLQELDISKNTKLRYLYCSSNNLTQLDVTNNLELQSLDCSCNCLSALDVSHNTALTYLDCWSNKLTQLDVTKNRNLQVLYCEENYLSELNVKNNTELTELYCGGNELTQLDVRTANRKLEKLSCRGNQLTSLDVSYNFYLKSLDCGFNGLTSLSVSGTNVEEIYCNDNGLTSLDVSDCASLSRLDCYHNQISGGAMDRLVASLPTTENGQFIVKQYGNGEDLNSCTAAQAFVPRQKGWRVQSIYSGWSKSPFIGQLPIAINETYFPDDAFRNYVSSNCDTDHDGQLSEVEALNKTDIDVSNRSIADLTGIEYFYALQTLHCEKNQLTSLNLYYNRLLKEVHCNQNSITGDNMQALIDNLPYSSGEENAKLIVRSLVKTGGTEGNSNPSNAQLATANKKRWDVYREQGGRYTVLAPTGIPINETTFPDAAFRTYVSENLDTNHDGSLSPAEQDAVTTINVVSKGIESLEGVEYFTKLQELICNNNALTMLDVSENTALTTLSCYSNQLTALDVSKNTALTTLSCSSNQLTALDVSKNTALTTLSCYSNQLTALDVSENTALTKLNCSYNQLTALDVSENTALTTLSCSYNQLTALDVSENTALTKLSCYNNQLTVLGVSKNTALTSLDCSYNQLTALDVSGCTALTTLDCYNNQLTALNVPCTALTYLNCSYNQLTALDVSNNIALTKLYCYNNQLTALDVSKNTALTKLSCYQNQLTALDVSKNTALTVLHCYYNKLTALDVLNNTALTELVCFDNRIRREGMDLLVNSLPETNGVLYVVNKDSDSERNFMTTAQANIVYGWGWAAAKYENEDWYYYYGEDGEPEDLDIVTGLGEASPLNDNGEMINDQAREWYSLDGRRVMAPQKGHIYIRGGKKVVY